MRHCEYNDIANSCRDLIILRLSSGSPSLTGHIFYSEFLHVLIYVLDTTPNSGTSSSSSSGTLEIVDDHSEDQIEQIENHPESPTQNIAASHASHFSPTDRIQEFSQDMLSAQQLNNLRQFNNQKLLQGKIDFQTFNFFCLIDIKVIFFSSKRVPTKSTAST